MLFFIDSGSNQQSIPKVLPIFADIWTWWVSVVDWDAWHKTGIFFSQFSFPVLITTSVFERVRKNLAKTKIRKIRSKQEEVQKEISQLKNSDNLLEKPLNQTLSDKYNDFISSFEHQIDAINKETQSALKTSSTICYIAAALLAVCMTFGWTQHMGMGVLIFLLPLMAPRILTKRVLEKHESAIATITHDFNTVKEVYSSTYNNEAEPALKNMQRFLNQQNTP